LRHQEDEEQRRQLHERKRQRQREAPAEAPRPSKRAPALHLPLPSAETWRQLPLRVDFQAVEEPDRYVIFAELPGLSAEAVDIRLSDDASALTIAGERCPSAEQAEELRQRLLQRLWRLSRGSPERLRQLLGAASRPEASADLYGELGQGDFGRFARTFTVPADADPRRAAASYEGGVLRVALPRARGLRASPRTCGLSARGPPRLAFGGLGHPMFF